MQSHNTDIKAYAIQMLFPIVEHACILGHALNRGSDVKVSGGVRRRVRFVCALVLQPDPTRIRPITNNSISDL